MAGKGKKAGIIIGAVFGVAAVFATSFVIVKYVDNKNNTQTNNPSSSIGNSDNKQDNKQDNNQDNKQDNNQDNNQDDKQDDKKDDKKDPPIVETTEEEYKAMFEEALPSVIENYFNENLAIANFLKIDDVKISLINHASGSVYVNCTQQGTNKFMELQCSDLKNASNYKDLSENISNMIFTTGNNKGETVQEEDLANEIVSYALEQDKVQAYLLRNGIDYTNYEILNATEFDYYGSSGRTSKLMIKFDNKIFNMSIGGVTGACDTQEDYLNKLKDGRLSILEDFELENYNELKTSSAESSAESVWVCSFPDDYNDLFKDWGNVKTKSGEIQFE